MKKTLLIFSFVILSISAIAQTISYGVRGGISFAHQEVKGFPPYYQFNTDPITTFSIGGFVDIRRGNFSLQPGIFFSGQGGETKGRYNPPVADQPVYSLSDLKSRLWYVQVPINIIYHLPAPFNNVYVGAGPYVAVGLFGNASAIESTVYPNNPAQNSTMNQAVKVSFGSDGYRLLQLGANALAGVRLKNRWLFNVGYDLGLTSISHNNPGYLNIKDSQFTVSAGYYLK